jgi:hypothetical protein
VTLSLIFCTAPIRPQRKRDPPPRSFALLNYCEKRANNAAAHVQLRQIYRPFLYVAAIINSVISVALFAGVRYKKKPKATRGERACLFAHGRVQCKQ